MTPYCNDALGESQERTSMVLKPGPRGDGGGDLPQVAARFRGHRRGRPIPAGMVLAFHGDSRLPTSRSGRSPTTPRSYDRPALSLADYKAWAKRASRSAEVPATPISARTS